MTRRIFFEPASPEAFLQALLPLWQAQAGAWLPGEDAFAAELAVAAEAEGITLHRGAPLPDAPGCPIIILTETSGAELQTALLRFIDVEEAIILAPITDWHFSQRPLFLISIPKSGTHLIYELAREFGYHAGGEPPEFPNGQTWYNLEYQNSHTAAADFFVDTIRRAPFGNRHHRFMSSPAIFIYRHPLDILVSEAYYYHLDGKTAFAGWFDGLEFEGRAGRLLNENFLLGSLRERTAKFLPWLDFPNVIGVSFEELVGEAGGGSGREQLDVIWSLLLKLQAPGDPREIAAKIFNTGSATFRAGQIGAYRRELPSAWVNRFAKTGKDVLAAFGYAAGQAGMLPEHRLRLRQRPLAITAKDFDRVPITLESGYLGCNLVRYARRIYAVPVAAGDVALEHMPAERLAALPSSTDLAELKALLLVGAEELGRRQHAFTQLGAVMRGAAPPDHYYAYWTELVTPAHVESYKDYNIICFQRRFYGMRQSIGAVDLNRDPRLLLEDFAVDEFIVASSVAQLRDEIDGLSAAHRLRREIAAAQAGEAARVAARLEAQAAALNAALAKAKRGLQDRLAGSAQAQAAESAAISERLGMVRAELNTALSGLRNLEDRLHGAADSQAAGLTAQRAALGLELNDMRAVLEGQLADAAAAWNARWAGQDGAMAALHGAFEHAAAAADAMRRQLAALEAGITDLHEALGAQAAAAELARADAARMERQLAELRTALDRGLASAAVTADAQLHRQEALRDELTLYFDTALAALRQQLEQQTAELRKQGENIADIKLSFARRVARWLRHRP